MGVAGLWTVLEPSAHHIPVATLVANRLVTDPNPTPSASSTILRPTPTTTTTSYRLLDKHNASQSLNQPHLQEKQRDNNSNRPLPDPSAFVRLSTNSHQTRSDGWDAVNDAQCSSLSNEKAPAEEAKQLFPLPANKLGYHPLRVAIDASMWLINEKLEQSPTAGRF
jgi:hypothetical protein